MNGASRSTIPAGIEDHATCDILRAIGRDKGQGYLFSRPVLAAAVDDLVSASFQPTLKV